MHLTGRRRECKILEIWRQKNEGKPLTESATAGKKNTSGHHIKSWACKTVNSVMTWTGGLIPPELAFAEH